MRILLVSNYYPEHVGGIETVAHNLASGYRRLGHAVEWMASDCAARPHAGNTDDHPMRAWNVTEEHFGFPYPIPAPGGLARLIAAATKADVIHIHDCLYVSSVAASLAGRLRRKPIVITQHIGIVPYRRALLRGLQHAAYATLGRLTLAQASRVFFVSQAVADWFGPRLRPSQAPTVIGNGVDDAIFKPLPPDQRESVRRELGIPPRRPLLLFSGRLVEKKGLTLLKPVAASQPDWSWLFIGPVGDVDPAGWQLLNVQQLPPTTQVDLARLYAAADLLLMPSVGEGFPAAVQEAMACGTPVLVSDELRAAFPDAPAFSSRRNPDAIRQGIGQALNAIAADSGLRQRVAAYAGSRWSWARVVSEYETTLRRLGGSADRSSRLAA